MAAPASHEEERVSYTEFACQHGLPGYRRRLADLYATWHRFNTDFFGGRLLEPHLTLDRTAPRSLGHCAVTTGYGGKIQITLHDGLVFGTQRAWVVRSWPPAPGTGRFIEDLLLRLTVRQVVLEQLRIDEAGYGGFGPLFVGYANVIGTSLGIGPVVARRRGPDDGRPVAAGWPHCVRPHDHYGTDLTDEALALAGCAALTHRAKRHPATPSQGLLELMQYLWQAGRIEDVRRLIERHLSWSATVVQARWRARRAVETGQEDVDGSALGEVTVEPGWMMWNGGTVRRMANSIYHCGSFADLPLLADALELAGCDDGQVLRHLRAQMKHDRRCWVLQRLLSAVKA